MANMLMALPVVTRGQVLADLLLLFSVHHPQWVPTARQAGRPCL
jgi:hypothetical protein